MVLNAAALAAGRIFNAMLGVVGIGIATRYLGRDAFGALIAATTYVGLMAALTDLGVLTIGTRELAKNLDDPRRLLGNLLTLSLALSVSAAIVGLGLMFVLYPGSSHHLERVGIALLILLPLPLSAIAATTGSWFTASQKAYVGAAASTVGSVLTLLLLIATDVFGWGFTGVVIAYAGQSVGFGLLMLAFSFRHVSLRPRFDRELARNLIRWGLPLGGAALIGSLYWRVDVILLSLFRPNAQVALYGLAFKVVDVLFILPSYIMITLMPELARLTDQRARLNELVAKAFRLMQVVAAPLLVFFVSFAAEIVDVAGGGAYKDAGFLLQILMIGVATAYLSAVFAETLIALNRQGWLFKLTILLLVVNVALNLALIPPFGARGSAIAWSASEVLAFLVTARLFRQIGAFPPFYKVGRILAAAGVMAGVALIQTVPPLSHTPSAVQLLVVGPLSVAAYVAALYAFKAMPTEVHNTFVRPVWTRVKPTSVG